MIALTLFVENVTKNACIHTVLYSGDVKPIIPPKFKQKQNAVTGV